MNLIFTETIQLANEMKYGKIENISDSECNVETEQTWLDMN